MKDTSWTVAIIGAGRMGAAVAHTMGSVAKRIKIWSRRAAQARTVAASAGAGVDAAASLSAAVEGADVTVLAVPLQALRSVARRMSRVVQGDHVILHATRGVEPGFVLPHTILREETCVRRIGVLGGPIYAPQLAGTKVIAAVLGTRFAEPWEAAVALTQGSPLRLHRTADVVGVADGLRLGDTARGLFLTRGLMEAAILTTLCGGDARTLVGLAGVGDLTPRHVVAASRHVDAGRAVACGTLPDAVGRLQLDGLKTAQAAIRLAERHHRTLPLMQAAHDMFGGRRAPDEVCAALLALDFDPSDAFASGDACARLSAG